MERNDIIIIHGTDYKEMAKKVLERADVAERSATAGSGWL